MSWELIFLCLSANYYTEVIPTYTKDIKPVFQKHCAQCHNANWQTKNWMVYKTAFINRDLIRTRVQQRTMPPGNLTNMTPIEKDLIIQWVDKGAKE